MREAEPQELSQFGLETRLFVLMKRVTARSIDLDYFRRSADYRADVLAHAATVPDDELRALMRRLQPEPAPAAPTRVAPVSTPVPDKRYVATLR